MRETVELAVAAERLGYTRYWVAEHHNTPALAATSPAIMTGQIAAMTRTIRVGSGGVLLSNYSPLHVAETFRVLESLYPGRIDLGLGRAPGGDRRVAAALAAYPSRDREARQYAEQVADLIGYLSGKVNPAGPFAGIRAGPTDGGMPEIWLLGSGVESAQLAARRGLPLSLAHFLSNGGAQGPAIAEEYRRTFKPSPLLAEPKVNIAVSAVCAESEQAAEHLASSLWLMRLRAARGQAGAVESPDDARAHASTPEDVAFLKHARQSDVVGNPQQVMMGLEKVAALYRVDDLSVITICYSFAARVRSYELIAEACGLGRP